MSALAALLAKEEEENEKKVSRFEGDIDLKGVDAADLEAMEEVVPEEGAAAAAAAIATPASAVAPVTAKVGAKLGAKK